MWAGRIDCLKKKVIVISLLVIKLFVTSDIESICCYSSSFIQFVVIQFVSYHVRSLREEGIRNGPQSTGLPNPRCSTEDSATITVPTQNLRYE